MQTMRFFIYIDFQGLLRVKNTDNVYGYAASLLEGDIAVIHATASEQLLYVAIIKTKVSYNITLSIYKPTCTTDILKTRKYNVRDWH